MTRAKTAYYTVTRTVQTTAFNDGGTHYALGKLMNTYHVHTALMSPALNGSSALEHFEHGNAIEIRNGIMFDFYPGLLHML